MRWATRRRLAGVALASFVAGCWFVLKGPAPTPEMPVARDDASLSHATLPAAPAGLPAAAAGSAPAVGAERRDAQEVGMPPGALKMPDRDLVGQIREALAKDTPAGALDAASLIKQCIDADANLARFYAARDRHEFQDVLLRKALALIGLDEQVALDYMQQEQRNCQGMDAQTRAMRPALLQRALDAGVEGAAVRYLEWLLETQASVADPARLGSLRQAIRSEAAAGSIADMSAMARDELPLGQTPLERHTYRRAIELIQDSMPTPFFKGLRAARQLIGDAVDPSLTPEQLQAAEQQAQRLFETYERRSRQEAGVSARLAPR